MSIGEVRDWVLTVSTLGVTGGSVPVKHEFAATGSPAPQYSNGMITWHSSDGSIYGFNTNVVLSWTLERVLDYD